MQRRDEIQIFGGRQAVVQRARLRDVSDALLDLERLRHDVKTGDDSMSVTRLDHPGENFYRRRLASAVRSEEPDDLTRTHAQTQPIERQRRAVSPREVLGLNHRNRMLPFSPFSTVNF